MAAYSELLSRISNEGLTSALLDDVLDCFSALIKKDNGFDDAAKLYNAALRHENVGEVLTEQHLRRIVELALELDRRQCYSFVGEILETALFQSIPTLGPDAPVTKWIVYEYAENLRVREHYIEAIYYFSLLYNFGLSSGLSANLVGSLYKNMGHSLLRAGLLRDAKDFLNKALEFFSEADSGDPQALMAARGYLAEVEFIEGEYSRVIEIFNDAISADGMIDPGMCGMTSIVMPLDGSFAYVDVVRSNVEQMIEQIFESDSAHRPFVYHQLIYLFQASFGYLLEEHDPERFRTNVARVSELASTRLYHLANSGSQSSILRLSAEVGDLLNRILSVVVEHEFQDQEVLNSILELGQITKGAVTRLLRGRKFGSPSTQWSASLRDWYLAAKLDDDCNTARRDYEMHPTLINQFHFERLDRALSERMTSWNAYRYLGVVSDPPDEGSLALEYFAYSRRRPGEEEAARTDWVVSILRRRTGAMVRSGDQESPEVELLLTNHGSVTVLQTAIDELRRGLFLEMQLGDGFDWQRKASFLGRRLLPVFPSDEDRLLLVIIPDKHLHLVPFDVLQTDRGDKLADRFQISFAQSWRDLADMIFTRGVGLSPACVGNPDFDLVGAQAEENREDTDVRLESVWKGLGRHPFERFEFEEGNSEVDDVARIVGVIPIVGPEANATELLRMNSPSLLHISTHGFYLDRTIVREEINNESESPDGYELGYLDVLFNNPQNRAGLVFAGANLHLSEKQGPRMMEQGFVFATEIEALDLRHTELVSLSACVTGLGDEVDGDGIAGVRRAFFAAGAESVVSTIWDVPVDSTRDFFVRFYQELANGASRVDALELAKATVAESYPGEHYRYAGFHLYGPTKPIEYFVDGDRLVIQEATAPRTQAADTPAYTELVTELESMGISLEDSQLTKNQWLRGAYRNGIWSIRALRELARDPSVSDDDRQVFSQILRSVLGTLTVQ